MNDLNLHNPLLCVFSVGYEFDLNVRAPAPRDIRSDGRHVSRAEFALEPGSREKLVDRRPPQGDSAGTATSISEVRGGFDRTVPSCSAYK